MPFKDPEKRREYRREWYSKNKFSEKEHIKRRKREIKKWFNDYKEKLKCSKCGEDHPATIDFHHKQDEFKEKDISYLVYNGYALERIKKEIKKCQILCSNCHRKLHWKNKNL